MNRTGFLKLVLHGGITCLLLAQHVTAQSDETTTKDGRDADDGPKRARNPGMIRAILIVVGVFFLSGLLFLFVCHCIRGRFSLFNSTGTGSILRRSQSVPDSDRVGVDPAVVNTFPTFLYSEVKGHKIGQETLECAVCLLEFDDHETLRLLPRCSHVFHPNCIDAWLALHVTCPVCRANLAPKPGELTEFGGNLPESNSPPGNGVSSSVQVANDLIIDITKNPSGNYNKLHRTQSTDHESVGQTGENIERFALRLPEDVWSQLMKRSVSSTTEFLSAKSSRKGYRSTSTGTSQGKNYERFDGA